jgi:hypothetical protein
MEIKKYIKKHNFIEYKMYYKFHVPEGLLESPIQNTHISDDGRGFVVYGGSFSYSGSLSGSTNIFEL